MEINKAVDLLDNLIGMVDDNQENDYDTAFYMAIEALKTQEQLANDSQKVDKENGELISNKRTKTHACDYISRKAAIYEMEETDWYHISKDGQLVRGANSKEDEPLYKASDVYKALERVPSAQPEVLACGEGELIAQPESQWIPCSERLPEERQEILATTTDNAWGDVVIIRTYYKEMHKSVIAWMPLPEPYAERRTDGQAVSE